jgi:hypothetical protein
MPRTNRLVSLFELKTKAFRGRLSDDTGANARGTGSGVQVNGRHRVTRDAKAGAGRCPGRRLGEQQEGSQCRLGEFHVSSWLQYSGKSTTQKCNVLCGCEQRVDDDDDEMEPADLRARDMRDTDVPTL